MKKTLLLLSLILSFYLAKSQNWTKISGISDSSSITDLASINNKVVISGSKYGSPVSGTFFISNDGGNSWTTGATFDYAVGYMDPLPINNTFTTYPAIGGVQSQKLTSATWSNFSEKFKFAEFPNGEIIGGSYNLDSVHYITSTGIVGATINSSKLAFGIRGDYFAAANNRLFFMLNSPVVIGSDFSYIDFNDLSTFKVPQTLDGSSMTATNWKDEVSVTGMIMMNNGDLIASCYDKVLIKSIDNGINWTTLSASALTPDKKLYKNTMGNIYGISGGTVVYSIDGGITFINISGDLTNDGGVYQLYVNALDEVFVVMNCVCNEVNPSSSGIYKLGGTTGIANLAEAAQFEVYPNPTSGIFTFKSISTSDVAVSIFNLMGSTIFNFTTQDLTSTIDLSNQAAGVYFLQATVNGRTQTQKLIVQ